MKGGGWNQSRTFWTRKAGGIKTVVMGKGKDLGDMQARDMSTWNANGLNAMRTYYPSNICDLDTCFPNGGSLLSKHPCILSPVQVCLSHKNNYHLLHTSYVLGILNMLLLILMTVLNRKWHGTNFRGRNSNSEIKGFAHDGGVTDC